MLIFCILAATPVDGQPKPQRARSGPVGLVGQFGGQAGYPVLLHIDRFGTVKLLVFFGSRQPYHRLLDPPVDFGVELQFRFHNIRPVSLLGNVLLKFEFLSGAKQRNQITAGDIHLSMQRLESLEPLEHNGITLLLLAFRCRVIGLTDARDILVNRIVD